MPGKFAAVIVATCLLSSAPSWAQEAEDLEELETVLVIGEQPGPGLWKVSQGDHVMWVLASHGPLPKGMTWRSRQVEARIAESQQVLYPGSASIDYDVGFFRMLGLIPAAMKADDIPGGKTLKDVLPVETWEEWSALRERYLGHDSRVERSRPTFALRKLRAAAYSKHRLSDGPVVGEIVRDLAKKHKVKVRTLRDVKREIKVKGLDKLLKRVREIEVPDLECFTTSLARVEADIEQLKVRANAWARGNVEELRSLHLQRAVGSECGGVLADALIAADPEEAEKVRQLREETRIKEQDARRQLAQEWVAAAQAALQKNRTAFAILPIRQVVSDNGYIAELRKLGYQVEEP